MRSRGAEYWSETLSEYRGSGLTQGEFCRRRGLSLATFRSWLYAGGGSRRDRRNDGHRQTSRQDQPSVPRSSFVPISIVGGVIAEPIELLLSGDLRILVRPGFDTATLKQLLLVLQESGSEGDSSC